MRVVPALAAMLLAAPALAACGSSPSLPAEHRATIDSTVTQAVTEVKVVNGVGDITVHAGSSASLAIHRVVHYHADTPPRPGEAIQGRTLLLTANCGNCAISYDLTVPASTGVTIDDSVGTINLDGMAGPIVVTAASGHVQGVNLRAATVDVRASAGAVDLSFRAAPTQVTAHSTAGAISVEVPGGPYAVDATATVGAVLVNVVNSPAAANRLKLSADVGAVTVNPAPNS